MSELTDELVRLRLEVARLTDERDSIAVQLADRINERDWLAQQLASACQFRRAEECPITGHSQCPHDSNMCACLDVEYVEWHAVASREVECHAN